LHETQRLEEYSRLEMGDDPYYDDDDDRHGDNGSRNGRE
jgi:hypothetical protein